MITYAIARIYLAQQGQREYSLVGAGVLCLVNTPSNLKNIVLLQAESAAVLWTGSLVGDIQYIQDKPYFHSFITNV